MVDALTTRLQGLTYNPIVVVNADGSHTVHQNYEGEQFTTYVSAPINGCVTLSDDMESEHTVVDLNGKGYESLECIFSLTFG